MAKTMRRCSGSKTYGIAPHEAPVADFPKQPSQKDGLGRMCKTHWNQYTASLARDRKARLAGGEAKPAKAKASHATKMAEGKVKTTPTKATTKRERRRTPMAHLPAEAGSFEALADRLERHAAMSD